MLRSYSEGYLKQMGAGSLMQPLTWDQREWSARPLPVNMVAHADEALGDVADDAALVDVRRDGQDDRAVLVTGDEELVEPEREELAEGGRADRRVAPPVGLEDRGLAKVVARVEVADGDGVALVVHAARLELAVGDEVHARADLALGGDDLQGHADDLAS